jgi:hypothetical protein
VKLALCAIALALLPSLVDMACLALGWPVFTDQPPNRVLAQALTGPIFRLLDFSIFYCLLVMLGRLR